MVSDERGGFAMNFSIVCLLLLSVPLVQAQDDASEKKTGVKITVEFGPPGSSSQRVSYFQGDRKRMEYQNSFGGRNADGSPLEVVGPRIASITRCDLGQMFGLNLDSSEYDASVYPPKPFTKEEMERRGIPSRLTYLSDKPTLRIEMKTVDTSERKEMFGHIARHVIKTETRSPLEGSMSQPQESVTDGWYIDFDERLPCDRRFPEGKNRHAYSMVRSGNQPMERPEFVTVGEPEKGLALIALTKTKGAYKLPDGTLKQTETKMERRVIEFEEGPLDPALFEIPAGFKHVDRIERNPPADDLAGQGLDLWQRVKASVARFFNL
jgi:hypothetical protein